MIRVEVTGTWGSTPRETGAAMFVTASATQGTIGGGQLEYMAIDRARQMLARDEAQARMNIPLGPEIGQCCGGRVELSLARTDGTGAPQDLPQILIFGAGHVGRALARALALLPLRPILIDQRADELALANGCETRLTPLPEAEVRAAPPGSSYVILTHDHALDFLLGVEALKRPDAPYVGMIGSKTKRARFCTFARQQGADTTALICPIGAGFSHDKRPEIIAAFTAAELIAALTQAPISALNKYPCDS